MAMGVVEIERYWMVLVTRNQVVVLAKKSRSEKFQLQCLRCHSTIRDLHDTRLPTNLQDTEFKPLLVRQALLHHGQHQAQATSTQGAQPRDETSPYRHRDLR